MDSNSSRSSDLVSEHNHRLDNMARFEQIITLNSFLSACHNGELENVKKLLSKDKELVNLKVLTFGQTGLQIAACQGHSKIVLHLLKNGAELTDTDGDNPLHYAVAGNQAHMIEDLIKAGIQLDAPNKKGGTPLHYAASASAGHLDCVKMLLKHKAKINVQDDEGDTPLQCAIINKNYEVAELLLNAPDIDLKIRNKNQHTVLHTAVIVGSEQVTRRILEKAPELANEKNVEGHAALHVCCVIRDDKVDMLKILVEQGSAEIDIRDNIMRTPLHCAAIKGFTKNMEYLIQCGAKVSTQNSFGDTPLHNAITERNNTVIDLLVGAPGMDFTIENKRDFSAFHVAIMKDNSYAFEKLLQKAPHLVNVQDKTDGGTFLHVACVNNRYKMMKTLIEKGQANIEITTLDNSTTLHFAVQEGYCRIVELLVTHQANVNARDIKGCTPLHVLLGCTPLHVLLLTARNNSRLKDHRNSPKIASIWNHLLTVGWKSEDPDLPYAAVCCFLVSAGADYTKKNNRGETVMDFVNLLSSRSRHFKNILHLYATDPKLKISFDFVADTADSAASSDNEVKVYEAARGECLACSDVAEIIQFEPCGHRVVCEPCSVRLKKCFDCKTPIQRKMNGDGKEVTETNADCCSICTVNKKNVMFLCGHSACEECSDALTNCHLCRSRIERKVRMY